MYCSVGKQLRDNILPCFSNDKMTKKMVISILTFIEMTTTIFPLIIYIIMTVTIYLVLGDTN